MFNQTLAPRKAEQQRNADLATKERDSSHNNDDFFWNDAGFHYQISTAITTFLVGKFGVHTVELVEDRLNEFHASLYNIRDLDHFSDALSIVFKDGAEIVAEALIKAAYSALGFETDRNYTRHDLRHALERLRELSRR